jgi:hypothetical protein
VTQQKFMTVTHQSLWTGTGRATGHGPAAGTWCLACLCLDWYLHVSTAREGARHAARSVVNNNDNCSVLSLRSCLASSVLYIG